MTLRENLSVTFTIECKAVRLFLNANLESDNIDRAFPFIFRGLDDSPVPTALPNSLVITLKPPYCVRR